MAQKKSTGKKATAKNAEEKTPKKTTKKATAGAAKETSGAESGAPDAGDSQEPEASMRTAAAKARGAAEDVTIVMTSRVKEVLQELDMRVDSDLVHTVNKRVQDMLTKAAERAKENQRKTVRPHDL